MGGAGSRSHLLFSAPAWSLVGEALRLMASCLPAITSPHEPFLPKQEKGIQEGFLTSFSSHSFPAILWVAYHSHSPQMPLIGETDSGGVWGRKTQSGPTFPLPQVILLRDLRLLAPGPEDMARDFEEPVIGIDRLRPSRAGG